MHAAMYPDVIVNGETVPHAVVAAETQNQSAPKGKPGIAWRKAANAVAIRTLLLQEAKTRAISVDPAEVAAGRFETPEEALIRGLLDQAVDPENITEDMIYAEWKRAPDRFRSPPLWEVSHILVACDPRNTDLLPAAEARAKALTADVLAKPAQFAALAARESDCGSKSNGGALGQLGPGDTVPEFEAVLRTLSEGDITPEPVLSRHGYHVIRLDALGASQPLPYEAVRPKINEAMEKAAWAKAAKDFIADLVAKADIKGAELSAI